METDYMDRVSPPKKEEMQRIPVEVTLKTNMDGKMTPLFIKWRNGCIYEIEKILDIKPRGMNRIEYKVMINGKNTYLYFNNYKWLVQTKG